MAASSRAAVAAGLDQLLAITPAELPQLSADLAALARLLDREGSVRRALADAAAAPAARRALADRLFGTGVSAPALQLLHTVVDQRWASSRELVAGLDRLAATAALRGAQHDGVLDDVEDELFRFGRILAREPQLAMALSDDSLPLARKHSLLHGLLDGRAQPVTVELLDRATTQARSVSVDRAIDELGALAAELRQRLVATVRAAWPLPLATQDRLTAALRTTFGRPVVLQVEVDPGLLGGVSVQVGDELLDGTVLRRLAEVRRRLTH